MRLAQALSLPFVASVVVRALPQQAGSVGGTLVGTVTPVATASATTSLPSTFTAPDSTPTNYQNTSGIPATPIESTNPDLPDYVINYAPVMYLHENESYWPSAWDVHLEHVYPWMDYTPLNDVPSPLTLADLNFTLSTSLYLSIDNPAQQPRPDWLYSVYGKPDTNGLSASNTTIITVNKTASIGPGYVDAYYFLLYSFNEGDNVGGQTYGNHISDIEYVMIRFLNGDPQFMFFSQHQDGEAYDWSAVQKDSSGRPIGYVAIGGHANYPVAGTFELVQGLIGLLEDHTSAGFRWDLASNFNGYWYSSVDGFVPAHGQYGSSNPNGPPAIGYLQQTGKWGNQALPVSDPNQQIIFGQDEWSDGATGPIDPSKGLTRTWLCVQTNCAANSSLPATSALQAGQVATTTTSAAIKSCASWPMLFLIPAALFLL